MQSRRDILKKIGTGVAGAAVVGGAAVSTRRAQAASLRAFAAGGSSEAPWALLSPLSPGKSAGKGWTATDLTRVQEGASILTLTHRDQGTARVHICARHGSGSGVAHSHLLDLVLMDGGDGDKRTDEGLGRVIRGLAKRVASNELGAVNKETLEGMARMLTHSERVALYGPEKLL